MCSMCTTWAHPPICCAHYVYLCTHWCKHIINTHTTHSSDCYYSVVATQLKWTNDGYTQYEWTHLLTWNPDKRVHILLGGKGGWSSRQLFLGSSHWRWECWCCQSRSSHDCPSPWQQPVVGVADCPSDRDGVGMGRRKWECYRIHIHTHTHTCTHTHGTSFKTREAHTSWWIWNNNASGTTMVTMMWWEWPRLCINRGMWGRGGRKAEGLI